MASVHNYIRVRHFTHMFFCKLNLHCRKIINRQMFGKDRVAVVAMVNVNAAMV